MNWKKRSGLLLMLTSVIHNLIGIVLFWEPLVDMFQVGLFNSVANQFDRATVFWFLLSGALIFILGHFMHWLVNDLKKEIPSFLLAFIVFVYCGSFLLTSFRLLASPPSSLADYKEIMINEIPIYCIE